MMGFFVKGEPIILKEGSSAQAQIEALERLRGTLPRAAEKQLEADIRALRAGVVGEERILFELKNSHMDMVVLQDIYLEHEGLTAQIDFLVLTRQRYFVIECKNLYGNIEVNERGDFVRVLPGHRREGMYSPITQNQRHIELIRAMRRANRSAIENALFNRDKDFYDLYRSFVVLANPKTVLDDRKAPADVRKRIIRADRLIESIKAVNEERGLWHDKMPMSAIRKAGEGYLEIDRGAGVVDYATKYRELAAEEAASPLRVVVEAPNGQPYAEAQAEQAAATDVNGDVVVSTDGQGTAGPGIQVVMVPRAPACPRCGAPMVLRTARRGARAGKQFYGCSLYPKCRGIVNVEGDS